MGEYTTTDNETAAFIEAHRDDDVRRLALKAAGTKGIDLPFALDQIAGRQAARRKLPSWAATDGIVYPPHLSMEQCSSEQTALYKAAVAQRLAGSRSAALSGTHTAGTGTCLIDITGGFGVDFSFMSRHFSRSVYVERQEHLCRIAANNLQRLGLSQSTVVNADGIEYMSHDDRHATLIFADPARRDNNGGRTFAIGDCTPDMTRHTGMLLGKAPYVMIKLSPMLDWRKAVRDIDEAAADGRQTVSEVHIVSAGGECKELLIVASQECAGGNGPRMFCAADGNVVEYDAGDGASTIPSLCDSDMTATTEQTYLYEPNASLMKAGCFGLICRRYGVRQIGRDSHLFVSSVPVADFPGRRFAITAATSMNKKELRRTLAGTDRANIAVRNFPMTAEELRKRLRLNDGGSTYIFATTQTDGSRVLLVCSKI